MADLFVCNCRQLVTLAGPARPRVRAELRELAIIPDGAMLIRDGRSQAAGPRREVRLQIAAGCGVIDAGGRIVLPGFVDAHTHTVFAGNRADEFEARAEGATYQEIAARGGGIRSTVRRTREASETELLEAAPEIYYAPEHYVNYPIVLVRSSKIDRDALQGLLRMAWSFVTANKPKARRRRRSNFRIQRS